MNVNKAMLQLAVLTAIFPTLSAAADVYVRPGGTCTSGCNSWTNAAGQITTAIASAARGDTIWVGSGSYNTISLDKPAGATITIRKATESSHGTSTGWSAAYGTGQATMPEIYAMSDNWVIDGQTRDESNWQNTASYGFRVTQSVRANTINFGKGANNLTFRYVDVGGPNGTTYNSSLPGTAFYLGGFGSVLSNWTISRCHLHNYAGVAFQLAGASDITIEYTWMGPGWNKETIRGQIRASNLTIRYNVMKDGCQGNPDDPTAGACTAQIGIWDGNAGAFDGSKIYGNVFWSTTGTHHTDGCIMVGGDNISAVGASANNVVVYNNTFVGFRSGLCTLRFPGTHSGDIAQNNLWYGLGSGVSTGCSANTCSHNLTLTSNVFVGAATGNFRLAAATPAGTPLASPYNVDMTGAVRGADGLWDIGAFEYSGSAVTYLPPTMLPTTVQ